VVDNRLLGGVIALVSFVCLLGLGFYYGERLEAETRQRISYKLTDLALSAANLADGEAHAKLRTLGSMESKEFRSEWQSLRQMMGLYDGIKYVYTMYLDGDQVKFGVDSALAGDHDGDGRDDQAKLGEVYDDPDPQALESLRTGKVQSVLIPVTDEWGTFVTGYAPIYRSDGTLEAVAAVDMEYSYFSNLIEQSRFFRWTWAVGSGIVSLLIGLSFLVVSNRLMTNLVKARAGFAESQLAQVELAKLNRVLDWQAKTDSLTGLMNRAGFLELTSAALESGDECAIAVMDLDDFKLANDHYGHGFGDEVLRTFGEMLGSFCEECFVARLGGDEFVVLAKGADAEARLAGGLGQLQAFVKENRLTIQKIAHSISASIGVASRQGRDVSCSQLIRWADIAMYESKRLGSGQVTIYTDEMGLALERRIKLEQELKSAWEAGEFWLAVQPIIDLRSGVPNAGEMLMRWSRRDGSMVSPADFVPVAEQVNLIGEMGLWAIEEACRRLELLEAELPGRQVHLSVNVSPQQLTDEFFVDRVEDILSRYQFHRGGLWLEITESSLIREGSRAIAMLTRIREMGVMIALDDFGTGYSSLSMLLEIPLDCLKIDRSFVIQLADSKKNQEVVRMIMGLSQLLDLYVVAEGIETVDHESVLREMGCNFGQGYFYSRPVEFEKFMEFCQIDRMAA
jgi:diguanylate cyclase (GGDEF)-like protein